MNRVDGRKAVAVCCGLYGLPNGAMFLWRLELVPRVTAAVTGHEQNPDGSFGQWIATTFGLHSDDRIHSDVHFKCIGWRPPEVGFAIVALNIRVTFNEGLTFRAILLPVLSENSSGDIEAQNAI